MSCSSTPTVVCASDVDCGSSTTCDHGLCRSEANAQIRDLRPERVVVDVSADSTVLSSNAGRAESFGANDHLAVGRGREDEVYRSYLHIDLGEIRNREVVHAELRLTSDPRWCQGDNTIEVLAYPAARSWSQSDITWIRQPGGNGAPVARAALRPEHNNEAVFEITELVAAWLDDSIPNQGVLLRVRRENSRGRVAWFSSESPLSDHRPVVEVEVQ